MRWHSPDHGVVTPERFIPILEETGMIVPFGEWMLRTCCAQNVAWQKLTGRPTVISVNVSTVQIRRGRFPETVSRVLRETGMPPETLEIEVTESVLLEDVSRTIEDLRAIRDLGCLLSMDDFGTGYSSLSYLRKLPIHTLKIDKSFVDDLARLRQPVDNGPENQDTTSPEQLRQEASAQRMIGSIISLAHDLQLEVIAEGVETDAQQRTLFQSRCDLLQGYIFHRPMTADEVTEMLGRPNQP
jgi:EAL domain-containing protein (putative c-di-GMP-specific phosphodiesterase class I)